MTIDLLGNVRHSFPVFIIFPNPCMNSGLRFFLFNLHVFMFCFYLSLFITKVHMYDIGLYQIVPVGLWLFAIFCFLFFCHVFDYRDFLLPDGYDMNGLRASYINCVSHLAGNETEYWALVATALSI